MWKYQIAILVLGIICVGLVVWVVTRKQIADKLRSESERLRSENEKLSNQLKDAVEQLGFARTCKHAMTTP